MELALRLPYTGKISKAQDDAHEALKKKVQSMKVEFLKEYLREKKVDFDDNITDYKELEKVVNALDKNTKKETLDALKEFNLQFESVVENLHDGHTGEFQKFIKNAKKTVTSAGKMPVLAMAGSTLVRLVPIMPVKVVIGAVTTAGIVYKGSKTYIEKRKNERTESYNFILKELEISKDSEGNIIDTRFSENMQENIKNFLKENHHEINGDSYSDLRSTIDSLDNVEKRKLINYINNQKGNPIDVDNKLKDIERPLIQRMKDDVAKPLALAVASGLGIATALNTISPAILASPVNAIFGSKIVDLFTDGIVAKWIGAGVGGIGTVIGSNVPFLNQVFKAESLGIGAVGGAIVGGVKVIKDHIFKGVKDSKERADTLKLIEEAEKKDKELYGEEKIEEADSPEKILIRNIMKNYFRELGVDVPNNGETTQDFHDAIEKLDDKDKKKVLDALNNLKKVSKEDRETAKDKLVRIGKVVFWVSACGLAGLGIVDIARPGTIDQILGKANSGKVLTSSTAPTTGKKQVTEVKPNENAVRHRTAGLSDPKTKSTTTTDNTPTLSGLEKSRRHRTAGLSGNTTVSTPSTDSTTISTGLEKSRNHRAGGLSPKTDSNGR